MCVVWLCWLCVCGCVCVAVCVAVCVWLCVCVWSSHLGGVVVVCSIRFGPLVSLQRAVAASPSLLAGLTTLAAKCTPDSSKSMFTPLTQWLSAPTTGTPATASRPAVKRPVQVDGNGSAAAARPAKRSRQE